jgi:hypothetical protein
VANDSGKAAIWEMNRNRVIDTSILAKLGPSWHISSWHISSWRISSWHISIWHISIWHI